MVASSLSLLRVIDMDRGWSMTLSSALPIVLFALALTGVARADNQQAQQSCVNAPSVCSQFDLVHCRIVDPIFKHVIQIWPVATALFDRIRRRQFYNFLMG